MYNYKCKKQLRFPGHLNDANFYQKIPGIGRHRDRDLPQLAHLLADSGYPARIPLTGANRALQSFQVKIVIDFSVGFQKIYTSISSIFDIREHFYLKWFALVGFCHRIEHFIRRVVHN